MILELHRHGGGCEVSAIAARWGSTARRCKNIDRAPSAPRTVRPRPHGRLQHSHRLPARYQADRAGALRDAIRPPGAGPTSCTSARCSQTGQGESGSSVVLDGARPQPNAVGPLRAAPGPADPAAMSHRRVRDLWRRARNTSSTIACAPWSAARNLTPATSRLQPDLRNPGQSGRNFDIVR
jgi:hypothetical protein